MLKKFISLLIIGVGIVAAIKIFLFMFIGGLTTITGALDAGSITFTLISINILKILFSFFVSTIVLYASIIVGALIGKNTK